MVADKNTDKPIVKVLAVRMPSGATLWFVPVDALGGGPYGTPTTSPVGDVDLFRRFYTSTDAATFIENYGYRPMICYGENAGTNNPRERFDKKGGW